MNVEDFVRTHRSSWEELDALLSATRGRPEKSGAATVRRMGELYRAASADLARLRATFPGHPAASMLQDLVRRARAAIYVAQRRRGAFLDYVAREYWRAVRARGRVVILAWLLLLGSAALAYIWALHDPAAAAGVVPASLSGGGGGPHRAIGLGASQAAALSVTIFTNNIVVTFTTFATGIALGVAPGFLLLYNGLVLGAVAGIASSTRHTSAVFALIVPHGILELSCIAVCGAVGMRMGWALVEPGKRSRGQALAAEAPRAVLIVLGTAPWLVAAGLVEGFVTPHRLPLLAAIAVGVALAAPYWLFVSLLGRRRSRPETTERATGGASALPLKA